MPDIREPNLQLPVGWNLGETGWGGSYNFAMGLLGATSHLEVVSSTENTPPPSPADGVRYLIPDSPAATGDWAGQEGDIAVYRNSDSAWTFYTPRKGMRAYVEDDSVLVRYDGTAWQEIEAGASSFFELTDTPSTGTGSENLAVVVNSAGDALEFAAFPTSGASSFLDLDDTPSDYTGLGDRILVVSATEDGISTIDISSLGIPENIEDLGGVPSFTGESGKMLVINGTEDGLVTQTVPSGGGGGGGPTTPATTEVGRIAVFDSTDGSALEQGFPTINTDGISSNDAKKFLENFTLKNSLSTFLAYTTNLTPATTLTIDCNDSEDIHYVYFDGVSGDTINISLTNTFSSRIDDGTGTPERATFKLVLIEIASGTYPLNVTQDAFGVMGAGGPVTEISCDSDGIYMLLFMSWGYTFVFDCGLAS